MAGEVFYPGEFSLEKNGETLSSVLERAGGLKPTAYAVGARVVRSQDGVGNIAIDLREALAEPGSEHDIILEPGDRIIVPNRMYTVKVTGEVGFPTSLVWEEGRDIDYYVERAGGYLKPRRQGPHPRGAPQRHVPAQQGRQRGGGRLDHRRAAGAAAGGPHHPGGGQGHHVDHRGAGHGLADRDEVGRGRPFVGRTRCPFP